MRFGRWHEIDRAAARAPAGPGLFQVRLGHGLVRYPRGRSAMIYYRAAADLGRAVAELAEAHPGQSWLVRFSEDLSPGEAERRDAIVRQLLERFERRFGALPTLPPT